MRVNVIDDAILEVNETFFGVLTTNDSAVNFGTDRAEATVIEDNDGNQHSYTG